MHISILNLHYKHNKCLRVSAKQVGIFWNIKFRVLIEKCLAKHVGAQYYSIDFPLNLLKSCSFFTYHQVNPLNPELNPICYLLALLGAHHFLHVSRIRVKLLTLKLLMSYIYTYGVPILDVSRSHTTTQHSR